MKSLVRRDYKYLDVITAFFVAVLIISNIVAAKIVAVGPFSFDGATLLFPLTYIFGDILTEVYGYARSRKVIWLGISCNLLMAFTMIAVQYAPAAADWPYQSDFEHILGMAPRIVLASVVAFFVGEFVNSFILAKMKIWTKGKKLWSRTIGSTIIGEGVDTLTFTLIAFWGVLPFDLMVNVGLSGYLFKTLVEVVFTPVTYAVVNFLKKKEQEDYYDSKTDFNPFVLKS